MVLRNVGLGPLILCRLSLGAEDGREAAFPLVSLPDDGLVIPPLESRELLSFSKEEEASLRELELRAGYRDIYGRKHETIVKLASLAPLPRT